MADEDEGQEKTHEPSERQREKFKERGEIARSREVGAAIGLIATAVALAVGVRPLLRHLQANLLANFSFHGSPDLDATGGVALLRNTAVDVMWMLAVPLGVLWLFALAGGVAQSRAIIPKEPLKLRWEVFDLANAAKQKFLSSAPWVELAKGLIKLGVLGGLVWIAVKDRVAALPTLAATTPQEVLGAMGDYAVVLIVRALPVAIVIAALDYAYQYWRMDEKMKMTTQQLKEEHKEQEGDPHLRAARKARARQIAMARTLRNVQRADLVITNPTHFAVALRYRAHEAPAPIVVAKGLDHMALKIRQEAAKHDIPCVENRPLARALYPQAEEGHMIPEDYFGPVARILATVLKRRRKALQRAPEA
ncbi:MAG: EscU/YscU/HrcU family type III secretion system export apparatus switch protein [Pseudomonadota bacterium]